MWLALSHISTNKHMQRASCSSTLTRAVGDDRWRRGQGRQHHFGCRYLPTLHAVASPGHMKTPTKQTVRGVCSLARCCCRLVPNQSTVLAFSFSSLPSLLGGCRISPGSTRLSRAVAGKPFLQLLRQATNDGARPEGSRTRHTT